MFVLRAFGPDGRPLQGGEGSFHHLPIRIGRNPLNDFALTFGMVSAFHARIENQGGHLCVRDLGSTNGVYVPSGTDGSLTRIHPNTSVDLAPSRLQFYLAWHIRVQLELVEQRAPLRRATAAGTVLGNESMIALPGRVSATPGQTALYRASSPGPAPDPERARSHHPAEAPPHPAPGAPPMAPGRASSAGPPPLVAGVPMAGAADPRSRSLYGPPEAQRDADQAPATQAFKMDLETLALQGLRELATSLVPGRRLDTTGDLARFITKLHDALDVFCRTFVPLRQGHEQFISSLDLRQAAGQRTVYRSASALALERAQSPEAVALALLDPQERTFDGPDAVEGILADLMLHQVALLDGVMEGVQSLLDELSPENIESATGQAGAARLLSSKHRARWQEFRRRFERLSEGQQAFTYVFGQHFAEVYRQYWHRKAMEDGGGLRTDPPRG